MSNAGDVVTQWGPLITLKTPAILVRRGSLKAGDVVHSSHFGKRAITEVSTKGVTTTFWAAGNDFTPEAYDVDSLIPSYTAYETAAREQQELLEVAGLSKTLRDREATAYHAGHADGLQEGLARALRMVQDDDMDSLNQLAQQLVAELKRSNR